MDHVEYFSSDRRSWWEQLLALLMGRPEGDMGYQVPADSLFANTWNGAESVADVPEAVKAQIREEALLTAFNRLETSLRLLLYATTPGKEPPTPEHLHQILNVWRFELEHRVNLVPDTYCGAVQHYEPSMENAYTIDGRCEPGDRLRIRVPCWRMFEKIVIRGEAELLDQTLIDTARPVELQGWNSNATLADTVGEPAVSEAVPVVVVSVVLDAEPATAEATAATTTDAS